LTKLLELTDGLVVIDDRPILRHVNVALGEGEFLALMGANGSGKSTLVKVLVGLLPLTRGHLQLFGNPVSSFSQWSRVGYVPQRANALGGVPSSVYEVVATGRLSSRKILGRLSPADRRAIDKALTAVDLANRARDGVATLSGGQQQRVLIARALAGEPEVLFLDEPMAGIDYENQLALGNTLSTIKDSGATVVLVAHELGPLAPLVDHTIVLHDGIVSYDGAPLADHALGHHHHHEHIHPDHAPHVGSPLDPPQLGDP
jgi:zinc transport system ATP-binding protein